jgi:hypothetical protein
VTAATAPYRWCIVYVDTPDRSAVVAVLTPFLGPPDPLDVFRIPGFTIDVRSNPDRTGGDHYLDWPTTIEIDAAADVPDQSMITFVTGLVARLHDAALRVGTESEFPSYLPPPDTR